MLKLRQILFFLLPYLLRYTSYIILCAIPLNIMFYQKPKSLTILIISFVMLLALKIIMYRVPLIIKNCAKIYNYVTPKPMVQNSQLNYIECLFLSCFACDLAFDKNFAIIGCLIAVFICFGLDFLHNLPFKNNKLQKSIVIFLMILLTFLFVYIKYTYAMPIIIILFIATLLTFVQIYSYNIKKFGQPMIVAIAAAMLLNFINISVIS